VHSAWEKAFKLSNMNEGPSQPDNDIDDEISRAEIDNEVWQSDDEES